MKIKDKIDYTTKPKAITFKPQDKVEQALNVMSEKNIGSVIIVDEKQHVVGIITERDMMIRVLHKKIDPETISISEIMSTEVRCAKEDDKLVDWLRIMSNERFRHLPVVDDEGKLINVLSQGDFVAYTWPDLLERTKENLKTRFKSTIQLGFLILSAVILGVIIVKYRVLS